MAARQIIMDMMFLEKPLTTNECYQLFRSNSDEYVCVCLMAYQRSPYKEALERMQRLSILMIRDNTHLYMNEVFRRGIKGALTGRYVAIY